MPVRLDHDQRRTELAEAVWRVIRREGVRGASVRGVAREAGLSMGSVRYFFATQEELLRFAMRAIIERATGRIEAGAPARATLAAGGDAPEAVAQVLEEVLPLDDERLGDAEVWLAFTVQGAVDEGLARIRREADEGVGQLCAKCLIDLRGLGLVADDRDLATEIARLWSLMDGLTLHILLDLKQGSARTAREILRTHLNDLGHPRT
ncbi:MAG: TetR family transcriptional regulator C-terminal domain-containing protein [Actinomycetota bacterium]|nr:TetR family transcriptional regulator C-terminal domain-containing protein [Actinomycetota bacterium]